jgi:acylphosphatase
VKEFAAFRATVEGMVQGVGFRYMTLRQARQLGLTGYVRNLPGGSVEVLAEGEKQRLSRLRSWLGHGPPGAYVRRLEVANLPYTGLYKRFQIDF